MLRVLVRDSQSSRGYLTGYYDKATGANGTHSRFVTITSSRPAPAGSDIELHKLGDDGSDRSILGENGQCPRSKNGIVQVTNFTVKYEEGEIGEVGEGSGTEMAVPEKVYPGNLS
jgi:hypothetical protein